MWFVGRDYLLLYDLIVFKILPFLLLLIKIPLQILAGGSQELGLVAFNPPLRCNLPQLFKS